MTFQELCPACSNKWHLVVTEKESGIFQCTFCGTRFVKSSYEKIDNGEFFGQDYITSNNCWLFEDYREPALRNIWRTLKKYASKKSYWLDVGSATGHIFAMCSTAGMTRVTAVEPSHFGAARIRDLFPRVETINEDAVSVILPDASYDLCTVLDTLYFLPKPGAFLKKVHASLCNDGIVLCEVPNYKWLRLVGRVSTQNTHWKAYYDRGAIVNMLHACGFEVVGVEHNVGNVPAGLKGKLNLILFHLTDLLFTLTNGRLDIVPKLIVVARKGAV